MRKSTRPIQIKKIARVRDKATGDYFEVIEFPVSSTERSRLELPPSVVVDASALERRLRDAGAILPRHNTRELLQAIARRKAPVELVYEAQTGWSDDRKLFVLNDGVIGKANRRILGVNQGRSSEANGRLSVAGDWKQWRSTVGKAASLSSILMCSVCTAFAAPLLSLAGLQATARFRRRGETFSLLMLDLDQFKQVNDTLGHPAGDALLQDVASRLESCLRETDGLARLGGDEFAVILAGESDQRVASSILADRIIAELAKPFSLEDGVVHIGASIGIALAPEHSTNPDELMKMADMALYRAKGSGRNCSRVFGPEMTEAMSRRHELENDLRRAIENDELKLHYQPIIDTNTLKMCGAEALIRWQHPTKGMIPPDRFIPLAEEVGLISEIGEWVLHTACVEAMNWPADVKIAVNLSAKQFGDGNLANFVMYVLAETGLPPERLELEITETALIESATDVLPVLRQFKNLGISIALDDFGTGYSSLSQLTMFPFDKIKIDKSFTQNMTKRADCAAIISATMTLAQSLNKETTAEGVETADQYRLLRLAGVTSLQGYLFKRPGPASELDFEGVYGKLELENAA